MAKWSHDLKPDGHDVEGAEVSSSNELDCEHESCWKVIFAIHEILDQLAQ